MCDTFVVPPNQTRSGKMIFGKNSDREPNEMQVVEYYPAKDHTANEMLDCTYMSIPQVEHTKAILISRPFWMWGAEMGLNEKKVVIGNEAVFTKMPVNKKSGLTGMDLLRLALERAGSAQQALDIIIQLLTDFGQGGNCGYTKRFYYDNSYIIADSQEAWILEIAGGFWAAKKVLERTSISNRLSIGEDFDSIHPEAIAYARSKGWSKKFKQFHFANSYADRFYSYFSGSKVRHELSKTHLCSVEKIDLKNAMDILRSHQNEKFHPDQSYLMSDVCAHSANSLTRHAAQTCNSIITELDAENSPIAWTTMTSAPCTSMFKPVGMNDGLMKELAPQNGKYFDKQSIWWFHELLHRRILKNYLDLIKPIRREFQILELSLIKDFRQAKSEPDIEILMKESIQKHRQIITKFTNEPTQLKEKSATSWLYNRYWNRINRQAKIPL